MLPFTHPRSVACLDPMLHNLPIEQVRGSRPMPGRWLNTTVAPGWWSSYPVRDE